MIKNRYRNTCMCVGLIAEISSEQCLKWGRAKTHQTACDGGNPPFVLDSQL